MEGEWVTRRGKDVTWRVKKKERERRLDSGRQGDHHLLTRCARKVPAQQ